MSAFDNPCEITLDKSCGVVCCFPFIHDWLAVYLHTQFTKISFALLESQKQEVKEFKNSMKNKTEIQIPVHLQPRIFAYVSDSVFKFLFAFTMNLQNL